jgi:uracil-DNA glycosylase family 4
MPLTPKPESCARCPAYSWGIGFVGFEGPSDARLAFVGQGPGESEAYSSRPFHPNAPSGSRLTNWMHRSHFQRCDVVVGNIVQCYLPKTKSKSGSGIGSRDPSFAECQWCWNAHVGPRLSEFPNLEWVIPVGGPATKFLLGIPWGKSFERYAGTVTLKELPPVGTNG